MLNSVYSKKLDNLSGTPTCLTSTQMDLLKVLKSKSRFEQLMEVLPENWESTFKIKIFDNPDKVATSFMNQKTIAYGKNVFERSIISVVVSDKHPATPGRYEEHIKKDNDNPRDWKVYQGLTELVRPSFHVDHKLIWTTKERAIDPNSKDSLNNVDYIYTINIYVPSIDTLCNVENMKLNNL